MHELGANPEAVKADPEKLKVLFNEVIQMCLWYACLILLNVRVTIHVSNLAL